MRVVLPRLLQLLPENGFDVLKLHLETVHLVLQPVLQLVQLRVVLPAGSRSRGGWAARPASRASQLQAARHPPQLPGQLVPPVLQLPLQLLDAAQQLVPLVLDVLQVLRGKDSKHSS